MKTRETLLNRLLQTLVAEWGHERVAAALASLDVSPNDSSDQEARIAERQLPRKGAKPTATELVERAMLEGDQKVALLRLAVRYERKEFLPSVADVREFLIMMGENPTDLKDRKEAFRVLMRSLIQLPVERLQQLATTGLHSGPSQLGPLSDAIATASESLPRHPRSDLDG